MKSTVHFRVSDLRPPELIAAFDRLAHYLMMRHRQNEVENETLAQTRDLLPMQAIARVNRVFRDKPAGLIAENIGIAQNLKSALGQYSKSDQQQAGIDEAEAVAALLERLDVVRAIFHGFDYSKVLTGTPHQRLVSLAETLDWILARQDEAAKRETDKEAKKAAHRRYQDAVLGLSKAFALCSASDTAREIREEVGFFQTVRAAMVKAADTSGRSLRSNNFRCQHEHGGGPADRAIFRRSSSCLRLAIAALAS